MAALKHSAQRDAIIRELNSRCDHPTADEICKSLKRTMPNISIATVYRNLSALASSGKAVRIQYGNSDHFDGNTKPHYHMFCNCCHSIFDIDMPLINDIEKNAEKTCGCKIMGHSISFFGTCSNCAEKI